MGTVHSSTVVTVSGGFFISTNLIIFKEQWLTLGITASNSSSGTCTTLMVTVPWTRTTLSVWPFATPSSRARETSIKPLSNFSLTHNSEQLTLTVTALLDSQNTELTA